MVYQGASDLFLGTGDQFIKVAGTDTELDLEAELFVAVDSIPQGCGHSDALDRIRLVGACNDFTYRELIRRERLTGFGFVQGKPLSSLAPFVVEPKDLGDAWNFGKPRLVARVSINGRVIGEVPSASMEFSFQEIVAHAAATRPLAAGTLVSSGTVSCESRARGFGSIVELRRWEAEQGLPMTPFFRMGDVVEITWSMPGKNDVFGALRNTVAELT